MRRILFSLTAVALAIVFMQGAAMAAGTAASTSVSNIARVSWLSSGASSETVSLTTDTTVARVAGDSLLATADNTLGIGETRVFVYEIYNTGNATDSISIWVDSFGLFAGASGWTFTLTADTLGNKILNQNETVILRSLAPDAMKLCTVAVWANSSAPNSPDGAFAIFRLNIRTQGSGADTTDQYTGDNGLTYGFGQGSNDTSRATISAAKLALTKAIRGVTIQGMPAMPLPGATIVYELHFENQGSAAADSVILLDTIPYHTAFDTASYAVNTLGCTAGFHDVDTTAGWVCQVSTADSTSAIDNSYYSPVWTNLVNLAPANRSTVKRVRWIRSSVAAAAVGTMRFRVIIN